MLTGLLAVLIAGHVVGSVEDGSRAGYPRYDRGYYYRGCDAYSGCGGCRGYTDCGPYGGYRYRDYRGYSYRGYEYSYRGYEYDGYGD
jgi:hypothetical protein